MFVMSMATDGRVLYKCIWVMRLVCTHARVDHSYPVSGYAGSCLNRGKYI